jgi:hypothetical protein
LIPSICFLKSFWISSLSYPILDHSNHILFSFTFTFSSFVIRCQMKSRQHFLER